MQETEEIDPNTAIGDIEMYAQFPVSGDDQQPFVETIRTATKNGLTVVLYCLRETDIPPEIRRNELVTIVEVGLGEVRLP